MPRCNLCLKNHATRHCQVFIAKSIEERRSHVSRWNYCLNCLAHTHARSSCQSANRCAICGAKHHSMLHRERPHDVTSSSFEEDDVSNVPANDPSKSASSPTPQESPILVAELPTFPASPVNYIPPLVRVNLIHRGNPMWVTFLLDSKVETSFLKRSVANIFPGFAPDVCVEERYFSLFQVAPTFEPRSSYGPIARWKLEVKEADVKVPPPIEDTQLADHFREIVPHAHPHFAICREVDGVIGHRTLSTIMYEEMIPPNENLPKMQYSIFGWVISGPWHGCNCH